MSADAMTPFDGDLLEERLAALGTMIHFPPDRDMTGAIHARLEGGSGPWRGLSQPRRTMLVRLAAAAFILLAAIGAMLLIAPVRSAVADLLGIGAVRITVVDTPSPAPPGALEELGIPLTPEGATGAGFVVFAPDGTEFGDAPFRLDTSGASGVITIAYGISPTLPEAGIPGVGLVVVQAPGEIEPALFEKVVGPDTTVTAVVVRGERGFWIEGAPHVLLRLTPSGDIATERTRLAANVLLWQEAGTTIRLESALPLDEMQRIADGMARID